MSVSRLLCIGVAACAVQLATPSESFARRGIPIFLVTHGEVVRKTADVPPAHSADVQAATGQAGVEVGYKYDQFGLFWLEIWTWGGEPCLFKDNMVWEVPPVIIGEILGVEESSVPVSWRYRFPPGLLIIAGILGLVVAGAIWGKSDEEKAREKFEQLMQDERYRHALEIIEQHHTAAAERVEAAVAANEGASESSLELAAAAAAASGETEGDDGGFSQAIDYLVEQGINRGEAEGNLAFLVHVLVAASEVHDEA